MKIFSFCVLCAIFFCGCGKDKSNQDKPLVFWHGLSDQKAQALRQIVDDYNKSNPPLKVQEEFAGDYDALYRKTMSALKANHPPDLAADYESMVASYMKYHGVVDLMPYLEKDKDALTDIYPVFLESNRYENFGNKMLSVPFTKSILMLYYNEDMLREIGMTKPPQYWDQFIAACREIKKKKGITPLAFSRDASSFDAFVFSFGGEVYDAKANVPLFDKPATLASFNLIRDLFREGLAHEVAYKTFDDRNDFVNRQAAFFIRSSTSRPYADELIKDKFKWNMAVIPHGREIEEPRTVLFGMNISMFESSPKRQEAAWAFIKYFISTPVTAFWATKTGYLPIRKSAMDVKSLADFYKEHPANRQSVDAVKFAYAEPNVGGWQEIRSVIDQVTSDVIANRQTPQEAAQSLQKSAMKILRED